MGTSRYVHAGFALKFGIGSFPKEIISVKSCECEKDETAKFCPHCGKKVAVTQTASRPRWDEFRNLFGEFVHEDGELNGIKLPNGWEGVLSNYGEDDYYLGWLKVINDTDDPVHLDPKSLPDPEGIWEKINEIFADYPEILKRGNFKFYLFNHYW
jgi:hypothetical protein